MKYQKIVMKRDKKIALVAHDNKKSDLLEWVKYNRVLLAGHILYATGTTGLALVPDYTEYRNRQIDLSEREETQRPA